CISDPNREVHLRLLAAPQPDRRERSFLTKPDLFPADAGPQFIEEPATQRPRDASLQLNAASRPLIDGDEPLVFRGWLRSRRLRPFGRSRGWLGRPRLRCGGRREIRE